MTSSVVIPPLLFSYQQLFVYNTTLGCFTVDKRFLSWCYGKLSANDSQQWVLSDSALRPYNSFPQILLSSSRSSLNWLSIAKPTTSLNLYIRIYSPITLTNKLTIHISLDIFQYLNNAALSNVFPKRIVNPLMSKIGAQYLCKVMTLESLLMLLLSTWNIFSLSSY